MKKKFLFVFFLLSSFIYSQGDDLLLLQYNKGPDPDGFYRKWNDKGILLEEGNYLDGARSGNWVYHYTNGKVSFEGNFRDGEPDGKHKIYYYSGKLNREEIYEMGIKSDNWKSYNELGEVTLTIYYKDGKEYKIDGLKLKD